MKVTMLFATLAVAGFLPLTANSGSPATSAERMLERELQEREIAHQLAPIQSERDLSAYLGKHRGRASPLSALTPGAQRRFVQSLVFTERGLASFDYSDLQIELTATQIYRLLELFGVQRSTAAIPGLRVAGPSDAAIVDAAAESGAMLEQEPKDYPGYACSPPATCRPDLNAICLGDKCGMNENL